VQSRLITSAIFDQKSLLTNGLIASFVNFESPRRQHEDFKLASDGVIGLSSEFLAVTKKSVEPGDEIRLEIDFIDAMKKVKNKNLQKYLDTDGAQFQLIFTVEFRSIGLESNSTIRYVLPTMIVKPKRDGFMVEIHHTGSGQN
jgi:hypothetical protein